MVELLPHSLGKKAGSCKGGTQMCSSPRWGVPLSRPRPEAACPNEKRVGAGESSWYSPASGTRHFSEPRRWGLRPRQARQRARRQTRSTNDADSLIPISSMRCGLEAKRPWPLHGHSQATRPVCRRDPDLSTIWYSTAMSSRPRKCRAVHDVDSADLNSGACNS